MYSKIFEGKKIRMTNKHHKKLLERFDKNNFVEKISQSGYPFPTMINSTPCALCESFFKMSQRGTDCGKCTMAIFEDECYLGCVYVISKLLTTTYIRTSMGNVTYRCIYRKGAIRNLETITNFLKSFEKEK